MADQEPSGPLPAPTPETKHFWEGTRAGELRLQRCGACEKAVQSVEFAVDPNAQRLEGAGGRVDPLMAAVRHGASDDRGEAPRGVDRRLAPRVDDRARDPARGALLAEPVDHVGQLRLLDVAQ